MASCTCWSIIPSRIVKPRSAKTRSNNNLFKIPQLSAAKNLSDVHPLQYWETKKILHWVVSQISTLIVLWCLHDDHVCALERRFDGLLTNTLKQSRTMVVLFLNEYLKHCDIVRHKSSRSGQLYIQRYHVGWSISFKLKKGRHWSYMYMKDLDVVRQVNFIFIKSGSILEMWSESRTSMVGNKRKNMLKNIMQNIEGRQSRVKFKFFFVLHKFPQIKWSPVNI